MQPTRNFATRCMFLSMRANRRRIDLSARWHQFSLLSALTAVDYWPEEDPRFHVIYQLTSLTQNLSIQLRVPVNGTSQRFDRDAGVEVANWREREIMDMFGIEFEGHPDPRRILMPETGTGIRFVRIIHWL